MILAAIAFATMFAPLSSHVYTVEEEKPYPTVTSWTEQWSSVSTSYTTEEHTKTKYTFTDDPEDSLVSQDIDFLILEKEDGLIHAYLSLSHGRIDPFDPLRGYGVTFDFDGDGFTEYGVIKSAGKCELWKFRNGDPIFMVSTIQYELMDDHTLHVIIPIRLIDDKTSFYVGAGVIAFLGGEWHLVDTIGIGQRPGEYTPPNPIDLDATYLLTYTLYRTSTYTSTLSSIYTTTSTETHTLTEKVSLSYWHGWLPYPFFAGAAALAISTAIPYLKSRRKKEMPVIAKPEGVRPCPTCGVENPFDAEYCMECGAKLS
jgi:hypothetical protein